MSTVTVSKKKRAPRASQSGVPILIDATELKILSKALRKAPAEVRREFRTKWRAAAMIVAESAKSKASFSTRIPDSIKVRGYGANIQIRAGGDQAPEAAPLENKGKPGYFKHPVFERKNGDVKGKNGRTYKEQIRFTTRSNRRAIASGKESAAPWVSQQAHPYLAPALAEKRAEVTTAIGEAITTTIGNLVGEAK